MSSNEFSSSAPPDWAAVRREFPALQDWTFLNTATYGQFRVRLCRRRRSIMRVAMRWRAPISSEWFDDADAVRASAARLVQAEADDIAFITNASSALSILMAGIEWQPGDQVIALQHEFPNNLYWPALLKRPASSF